MKYHTAVSLRTNPAPVEAAPQKKIAISEDGLAMLMAQDALNSAVMRGSARKPKAGGESGPKIVSEKLMEKVLRIIHRAGRIMTTQEITRKAKCAPDTARIACRMLVDRGSVTMIDDTRLAWKLRGEKDPAVITPKIKSPHERGPVETVIDRIDPPAVLLPITDKEREIFDAMTDAPQSAGRIAAASGYKTHVVSPRLVRLRNAGYVEMHSRFNVRSWAKTGVEPPAHKPERQEVAGIPVTRVQSGGIRVTLPAMPEGLSI